MQFKRTAYLEVTAGAEVDAATALLMQRTFEWLVLGLDISKIGSTGSTALDQQIQELIDTGQLKIELKLDQPPNIPTSQWLGRKAAYQFLYYQLGYARNVNTSLRRRLARALAVFAASNGVTVICSRCRKAVGECKAYRPDGSKIHLWIWQECENSQPLVKRAELHKLRGKELILYDLTHPRAIEVFEAYVAYLISLDQ